MTGIAQQKEGAAGLFRVKRENYRRRARPLYPLLRGCHSERNGVE